MSERSEHTLGGVMHDLQLLVFLRARHARTSLVRFMYITYSDFSTDRSKGDRLYQLYVLAILAAWGVAMWAALLDGAASAFSLAGPQLAAFLLFGALLSVVAVFVVTGFQGLRASPVKLTRGDIAFVASSPLSMRALVIERFCAAALGAGAFAAVLGYVAGVCMGAGLGMGVEPFVTALAGLLLTFVAMGGAWVLGVVRLSCSRGVGRRWAVAGLALVGIAITAGCCALAFWADPAWMFGGGLAVVCASAAALCVLECAILVLLAPRIDTTDVIRDSALYADLQPFGMLSPLDQTTISDYRRRKKLAMRAPRLHLPASQGRGALVARSALSMVRQYEGLPLIAMQGAVAAPLGVFALSGAGGLIMHLFWLASMLLFVPGIRAATQAFRDDLRVRLVRDRLPFNTLELLVFDSLVPFAIVCAVSCVSVALSLPAGFPLAVGLALAVLLNAALFLSCGLDAVRLFPGGPRPSYEMGAIALVVVTALFSLAGFPLLTLVGVALVCGVILLIVRGGVESVR